MKIPLAPHHYDPQGDAPRVAEVAAFVRRHFGSDDPSLIGAVRLLATAFDGDQHPGDFFRKYRQDESKFWHAFRVALWVDGYDRNSTRAIDLPRSARVFCAILHDTMEDTRKREVGAGRIGIENIFDSWCGDPAARELIEQYFVLKTDPPELQSDARRDRQLGIARLIGAKEMGAVGELLAPSLIGDKWDHLRTNIVDLQAGRLVIDTREKKCEFTDIMSADRHIIESLKPNVKILASYTETFHQLMDMVSALTDQWAPRRPRRDSSTALIAIATGKQPDHALPLATGTHDLG